MLSISKAKSAGAAMGYHINQLVPDAVRQAEDYYSSSAAEPGRWLGSAAETLGLEGNVSAEDFARCLLGFSDDGKKLVQNAGQTNRRAGWDLTLSAPKSVSTLWALTDDATLKAGIEEAQQKAVNVAIAKLEDEFLISRRGKGGVELENAKAVVAAFDHQTSREQDPQLHTHCFLMNIALRGDETWGTIQSRDFFKAQKLIGYLYRVELASEMKKLGLEVERDGESFRLAQISADLERQFSKRREQIETQLEKLGANSAKAAEAAALDTRKKKESLSQEELTASWQSQAAELGIDQTNLLDHSNRCSNEHATMPTHEELLAQLTHEASTFDKNKMQAQVYLAAQGVLTTDEANHYFEDLMKSPHVVKLKNERGEDRYSSKEMYDLEKALAESASARRGQVAAVSEAAFSAAMSARPTLSKEQTAMLQHVTSADGISCVQGMAGTGKSFALGAARIAWEHDGRQVIGAALAGKAVDGLESGADISSQTLHSLLIELDRGKRSLSSSSVLVLDEAGMIGSRMLARLIKHVDDAQAKLVLVGDSKQLQPIEAGGAFRMISEKIGAAKLSDIQRQREEWSRNAVYWLADGKTTEALIEFAKRGMIHAAPDDQRIFAKMVSNFLKDFEDERKRGETLMFTATNADAHELNKLTHAERVARGQLSTETTFRHHAQDFCVGERILFTRNSAKVGVKNGVLATLSSIQRSNVDGQEVIELSATRDDGRIVTWRLDQYEHFSQGYAITIHKAQGITVDNSHIMIDERMSDLEWSYVAASRAREASHLYASLDLLGELEEHMSNLNEIDAETKLVSNTEQFDYDGLLKRDSDRLTDLTRRSLKLSGVLKPDTAVFYNGKEFCIGEHVALNIANGEEAEWVTGTLVKAEQDSATSLLSITVRQADGQETMMQVEEKHQLDYAYADTELKLVDETELDMATIMARSHQADTTQDYELDGHEKSEYEQDHGMEL